MVENEEGKREWGGSTSRRDSPSGFSSVPGHCTLFAGILFTHTRTHTCAQELTHTYMRRQMTINGYNNAESLFSFFGLHSHVFCF